MLKSIYIDNYALIEKLEIEFSNGLLLGKRADTSVLKDLERKCVVEGVFRLKEYGLEKFFKDNELDYQTEIFIRREISVNGKSRAFINDTPVNLDILQELTLSLIDIHSQHQNLLLNDDNYLQWIIDSYAGTIAMTAAFNLKFIDFQRLRKQYYDARESYQKDQQDLDLLTHQFNELQIANLKINELPDLEKEYNMLTHAEDIKSGLEGIGMLLQNEEAGIIGKLKQTIDLFSKIKLLLPDGAGIEQRVQSAYIDLKDIALEVEAFFDKTEFDPLKMEEINRRIDLLYNLLRKYKVKSEAELIEIRDQLDKKLSEHAAGDYQLEHLAKELAVNENEMLDAASKLSKARMKIFPEFETKVAGLLRTLGMTNAEFEIQHQETEPEPGGIDRIQFFFSANKNIQKQSISKIASGGELSRLMLTIKYLVSDTSGLPTIVFDEIDSGVSGDIADKVGNLVKEMAAGMQVINITHLPQVASKGDHHYLVYKAVIDNTTKTYIKKLDESERLNEIAKMLSGDSVSEAAIENAKVLLKSNR